MALSLKSRSFKYVLFVIAAAGLFIWIMGQSHARSQPTFKFIGYTNSGNQTDALFRLDYPPQHSLGDSLYELRYKSATGWTRPTAPAISWRFFGWDGTGSVAAVSVETTNVPARVVMCIWVRRGGLSGISDYLSDAWEKWRGGKNLARGIPIYVTNETIIATSAR